jgi:hypothetical protein
VKLIYICIASLLAIGCTSRYASNGENQYMKSKNGQNLVIPSPLSSDMISHFYDLPEQAQNSVVSITPP